MKDAIQIGIPGRSAALRNFDRASNSFDDADFVHAESRKRLLERLELVNIEPSVVLDLGAGTGKGSSALASAYRDAGIVAVDRSTAMLKLVRERCGESVMLLAADAEQLAIADRSVDLVFANQLLPWCAPDAVFAEVSRVLREDGVFCFATLGPDTLAEVRRVLELEEDAALKLKLFPAPKSALEVLLRRMPAVEAAAGERYLTRLRPVVRTLRAAGLLDPVPGPLTMPLPVIDGG